MKKTTLLLSLFLGISAVSYSFIDTPAPKVRAVNEKKAIAVDSPAAASSVSREDHTTAASVLSTALYDRLQLAEKGLSKQVLHLALKGYLHLQETGTLSNTDVLTIVDFSQSSRKKRFYLLDVKNQKLLVNTFVAHGKNSGVDRATDFSNTIGSEKSSLGFYVTKGTYTGKNGFSLRMAGLDKGFNDNAEARAIVVHGADYVNAGRVNSSYMGRSQGCPALPKSEYRKVIDRIKDGSALFVYASNDDYLSSSEIVHS